MAPLLTSILFALALCGVAIWADARFEQKSDYQCNGG